MIVNLQQPIEDRVFELDGQTAIVTGGASGIGEGIARRLAAAGATLAILDLDIARGIEVASSLSPHSFALSCDISKPESLRSAVEAIIDRTGQIDILVNNAGIAGQAAPLWEQSDENWDRIITINLTAVFRLCKLVVPHMRSRKYGRIVNIASIAGKEGNPNMSPYSITKAGVIALTKSLGKEVATEGICVNAVAPAVIRTAILEQLTPAQVSYMTDRIPMKRTGEIDEVAAVVHFLASRDCSFVTAQCYDVSGGRATY